MLTARATKGAESRPRCSGRVVRLKPDYPEGHNDLGFAFWQAGKRQEAIREYEYALRLKPNYADAQLALGDGVDRAGAGFPFSRMPSFIVEEALNIYSSQSPPTRSSTAVASAHVEIGNALLAQGKVQEAMAHYEEALRLGPDSTEAHYNLAAVLIKMGRTEDAIPHIEEVLRINPQDAGTHFDLGVILAQKGRMPEAMEQWEQVLKINPDNIDAHTERPRKRPCRDRARFAEAIEQYERGS